MTHRHDEISPELKDIVNHCRVLSYAITALEDTAAKEILNDILWEKLSLLYDALEMPFNEEDVMEIAEHGITLIH